MNILDMFVDDMGLSPRATGCLKRAGINTLRELCDKTLDEMIEFPHFGRKNLEEVLQKLKDYGLGLRIPVSILLPDATTEDSFQERLEMILEKNGLNIIKDSGRIMPLLRESAIDNRTKNIFQTILLTDVTDCLISYAEGKTLESELILRCSMILQEEWGMSPSAFKPLILQMLNAVDAAVKARRENVGKTICNQLKEMRRAFARANHIEYEEHDCTQTNPCNGTCDYCDKQTAYLISEAKKYSAVREIVYPKMTVDWKNALAEDSDGFSLIEESFVDGVV